MALPFFYIAEYNANQQEIVLNEENSRYIIQVLRMKNGEQINLTDGKGNLLTCEIAEEHKKHCIVKIKSQKQIPKSNHQVSIAISLIKNNNRFEWFLEKATEIGVNEIIPLVCERTEKTAIKAERLKNILVSAILQSQQCWLPVLHEPTKFKLLVETAAQQQKFVAYCIDSDKRNLLELNDEALSSRIILIGPEGDFTAEEIELALLHNFIPVSLGTTRLRTETAGVVAAVMSQDR